MAARSKSKKLRLEMFLQERQPDAITEDVWRELIALLAPISESYLRELLRATHLPVAQPFGGVRQSSFEELEASLLEIERAYSDCGGQARFRTRTGLPTRGDSGQRP